MSFTFIVLFAIAVARGLYLCCVVARDERVRHRRHGLVCRELRRRAQLVAHRDAAGNLSFPEPRETRTLVTRVAGLPVWREVSSIALPPEVEATIDAVRAADFDSGFDERFRAAPSTRFELTLA